MRWTVHAERLVYESDWMSVALADVELPDGTRFEHHVLRSPARAAGTVIRDPDRGFLLLWRHRFITDTWGWEIPAGRVDEGESLEDAAAREALEETGWRPGALTPLLRYNPMNGICDQVFNLFQATHAEYVGEPESSHEAERVEWVPEDDLRKAIRDGRIPDGLSLTGILAALLQA